MDAVFYGLLALAVLLGLLALALIVRAQTLALPLWRAASKALGALAAALRRGITRARALVPSAETRVALREQLNGTAEARYRAPRVVVLGHAGSGKSELLAALDAAQATGGAAPAGANTSDGFHYLDAGIAVELAAPGEGRGAWWRTLRRLDEERPERALDAVVVSVSVEHLAGGDRARILDVGRRISRQLRGLQQHLRLRLPVYLLVTKLDLVEGFAPFVASLDGGSRQIVGWSNPEGLDAELADGWCELAFRSLGARLQRLELGLVARGMAPAQAEAELLFPRRMGALGDAVALFASVAFARTAYDFQGSLRGVYFAGRLAPAGPTELVAELFERKIFAERNLAFAPEQLLLSRSRVLRRFELTAAAGFALLVLCLLLSALGLSLASRHRRAAVDALLAATPTFAPGCPDPLRVEQLLGNELLGKPLGSYLALPISLLDPRPASAQAGALGHSLLAAQVFPALRCRLSVQAAELAAPDAAQSLQAPPSPLERLAAMEHWEQAQAVFAGLAQSSPVRYTSAAALDLTHLVESVLAVPRAAALSVDPELTLSALQHVSYTPRVVPDVTAQRTAMADALLASTRVYRDRLVSAAVRGSLACSRLQAGEGDPRAELTALATFTGGAGSSWRNATPAQNPCSDLARALRSGFVTLSDGRPGYPAATLQSTLALLDESACYAPVAEKLAAVQDSWCGGLLTEAPAAAPPAPVAGQLGAVEQKALGLLGLHEDPAVSAHAKALRELARSSFLAAAPAPEFRCTGASLWDPAELEQARDTLLKYDEQCRALGPGAATGLPGVRQRLFADVTARVGRAELGAGAAPSTGVGRPFSFVAPDFVQLAALLRQLGATNSDAPWIACVNTAARSAFDQFSAGAARAFTLEAEPLPATLSAQEPKPRFLFRELADAPSASARYQLGLENVRSLAAEVRPYANWYAAASWFSAGDTPDDAAAVTTRDTLAVLDAGTGSATSPAARLSAFFGSVLAGLSDQNCAERLSSAVPAAGADAFSSALVALQAQARAACSSQRAADLAAEYQAVASLFESSLQGRVPFGPESAPDVSPAAVSAMAQALAAPSKANLALPAQFAAQNAFLRDLRASVALLAPLADGRTALGVALAFRATPPAGRPTEDILTWQLHSGTTTAVFPNGGARVSWHAGDPVSLALRWANRSPFRPAPSVASGEPSVIERAALFSEAGDWALFRFIAAHRARAASPATPLLLRFDVELDDEDAPHANVRASVVLGVTLVAADGSSVAWVEFPTAAPPLGSSSAGATP